MVDFYRFSIFRHYDKCLHAVSTKSLSEPSLFSLALHTGEDKKSIISNRKKLSLELSANNLHFVTANQTHSDHISIVSKVETKGWSEISNAINDCDALITDKRQVMLTVFTADCVPILLYDKDKEIVSAIHAGWRGTKANIVSKTVKKMIDIYGSNPKDIIAGIAPSIGRCCYEVDEDVAQHFFDKQDSFDSVGKKYMLDLPHINKMQLLDMGLLEQHIEMSSICTSCEVDTFFSYRKEKGCSGRFVSTIGLI